MRLSLKSAAKKGMKDYHSIAVDGHRAAWVLAQPAQLALLVSSIFWCQVRNQ
jgi:hypothetical protein